ncbi:MAG: (2Fe-2S)-binding protein [Phycisphaerales bacterium]|nr:MAG: (2Fe-2S)-binding protein [Phycisphaerales bacterium]
MDATVNLTVNGVKWTVTTDAERSVLEVLREELHLTGTKYGCGGGRCGTCAVLMDGKRVLSCTIPLSEADGKAITTIEGLASGDSLHPVQEAFLEEGAMQCGYCTSGMIMATVALLKEKPRPTDEEIVSWMNVNLCRCNGYPKILNAVRRAAEKMRR